MKSLRGGDLNLKKWAPLSEVKIELQTFCYNIYNNREWCLQKIIKKKGTKKGTRKLIWVPLSKEMETIPIMELL